MATIRDVARLAGVAPMTVSRVINKEGYVSQDIRVRVEAAIAELHYIPNGLSRSLRSKKTNLIALMVSDITNPFWTTVTRGVEDACSNHQLNVILCNTDEKQEKLNDYVNLLLQKQMDGFIVVPTGEGIDALKSIQKQGVPLVSVDRAVPHLPVDTVRCDSERGAYELTQYLIGLGHRRIAILTGNATISTGQDRVEGYRRALHESGLPQNDALISYGDFTIESGYQRALEFIQHSPKHPTALFAGNNFIAMGVIKALENMGLNVPNDISLVCFDDLPVLYKPFLTVMAQSPYQLGFQAAELLYERIANPETMTNTRDVIVPLEMFIRTSCKAVESSTDESYTEDVSGR